MPKRAPYGSYLYQPTGSSKFWFRFQYPADVQPLIGKKKVELPLRSREHPKGTSDPQIADILKLPLIHEHRMMVLEARNRLAGRIQITVEDAPRLAPGEHPEGIATPDYIMVPREPSMLNALLEQERRGHTPSPFRRIANREITATYAFDSDEKKPVERAPPPKKDADFDVIKAHIEASELRKDDADGLTRTLEDLKVFTEGKRLEEIKRKEARAFIDHLQEGRDLSAGRVKKLIAYLKAAISREIKENDEDPRVTRNVFSGIEIEIDEDGEERRLPLTESEVALLRENLYLFDDEMKLMLVWHISSSVRPGGIYSMQPDRGREWEDGECPETGTKHRTRYLRIMRDKGKYGSRCLPIPQAVLDLRQDHGNGAPILPDHITGPIFKRELPNLLTLINNRIEKLGIEKSLYSGRHRAKDRMMTRGVDADMRKAVMGHTRKLEAHDMYGTGFPMFMIKPAMDKIGF